MKIVVCLVCDTKPPLPGIPPLLFYQARRLAVNRLLGCLNVCKKVLKNPIQVPDLLWLLCNLATQGCFQEGDQSFFLLLSCIFR